MLSSILAIVFVLSLIMFVLPISMPRFKVLFFYQNSPKMKLFLKNNAKFLALGPPPQCLRRLGALPPDPH